MLRNVETGVTINHVTTIKNRRLGIMKEIKTTTTTTKTTTVTAIYLKIYNKREWTFSMLSLNYEDRKWWLYKDPPLGLQVTKQCRLWQQINMKDRKYLLWGHMCTYECVHWLVGGHFCSYLYICSCVYLYMWVYWTMGSHAVKREF